jgi:large subunit ribosomal protein L25
MAEDPKVVAEKRNKLGSSESRRLRKRGRLPANIYGHGEAAEPVALPIEAFQPIVHSGHRVVDIELDGAVQKTMIRDVQWNTFGTSIQHIDLVRISADETVDVEVPIELHGVSPGVAGGGVLEHMLRALHVVCRVSDIPDHIRVNINHLELKQVIHVSDIQAPSGVTIKNAPDAVVVQVVEPVAVSAEPAAEMAAPTEPELVGRKAEPEEGEEEK